MSNYTKEFLISEVYRWIDEHDGKIPSRDSMRVLDGYPSSYQYEKLFHTKKWAKIIENIGLTPNNKMWENHEIEFLKQNWDVLSDEEIAGKLKRKPHGVRYKRNELGLFIAPQKQPWQNWEKEYLKDNFYDAPQEKIEEKLSHRKWMTIRSYATKTLGLFRARFAVDNFIPEPECVDKSNELYMPPRHKKAWVKDDNEYIIENWNIKSDEEMAKHLGRTTVAVRKHRQANLKLYKSMKGNEHGKANNYKSNNKKIILLSRDKKSRRCKACKKWLPNTTDYFYKDGNILRTKCKECELKEQNNQRILDGSITVKLKDNMFQKGLSYCSMCNTWKRLDSFTINPSRGAHSYCDDCRQIEYATRYYGEDNTFKYFDRHERYMDKNGGKCDSIPEQIITNWLIDSKINYINHPYYNDYITDDSSMRKFDWIIYDKKEMFYFVEYFGYWNNQKKSKIESKYTVRAKKKIKDLYKSGVIDQCIFIFPNDLKNKTLDEIFEKYIDLDKNQAKVS